MYKINYPVLSKLNVHKILRIKANITFKNQPTNSLQCMLIMNFQRKLNIKLPFSIVIPIMDQLFFKMVKRVYSKENRLVVFDGHQKHCGVDCTDKVRRIVINYVYTEKEK